MLGAAFGAVLCVATAQPSSLQPRILALGADSLEQLYRRGRTWEQFYGAVNARKALWVENVEGAELPEGLVARARVAGGQWRFLVVAIDSCSDSANTIPYLAALVRQVEGLDMRIVDPSLGRWVMEAHRTSDGRAATPTVLLLDERFRERGCFIERPQALRRLLAALDPDEHFERKMTWYREDRGLSAVSDLVELIEAAARGADRCDAVR